MRLMKHLLYGLCLAAIVAVGLEAALRIYPAAIPLELLRGFDDDLRVEAPTLLAVDEQVRRYLHDRLVGDEKQELSLAYVWEDSERATPAAAGGLPSYKFSRPPRSLYFDVRESPGEGYLAEGESGLGIAAQTLEGLAPAARAEIARRWPDAMANDMPRVTFGWVRMAQV